MSVRGTDKTFRILEIPIHGMHMSSAAFTVGFCSVRRASSLSFIIQDRVLAYSYIAFCLGRRQVSLPSQMIFSRSTVRRLKMVAPPFAIGRGTKLHGRGPGPMLVGNAWPSILLINTSPTDPQIRIGGGWIGT